MLSIKYGFYLWCRFQASKFSAYFCNFLVQTNSSLLFREARLYWKSLSKLPAIRNKGSTWMCSFLPEICSCSATVLLLYKCSNCGKKNYSYWLLSWKTKKISRICRSVKGAETRSLETGLDEAIHFARMVRDIYDGKVDLKSPKQVQVDALTDNKGLWENLHNTRQCDEKLLRNSIALMKEMVERGEVRKIDWVETSQMLADIMTKQGGNGSWIKKVVSTNIVWSKQPPRILKHGKICNKFLHVLSSYWKCLNPNQLLLLPKMRFFYCLSNQTMTQRSLKSRNQF